MLLKQKHALNHTDIKNLMLTLITLLKNKEVAYELIEFDTHLHNLYPKKDFSKHFSIDPKMPRVNTLDIFREVCKESLK